MPSHPYRPKNWRSHLHGSGALFDRFIVSSRVEQHLHQAGMKTWRYRLQVYCLMHFSQCAFKLSVKLEIVRIHMMGFGACRVDDECARELMFSSCPIPVAKEFDSPHIPDEPQQVYHRAGERSSQPSGRHCMPPPTASHENPQGRGVIPPDQYRRGQTPESRRIASE